MRNARLCRLILARAARAMGYRVSGNHVFTADAYEAITRGAYRTSVSEHPQAHPPRAVRLARLLSATY